MLKSYFKIALRNLVRNKAHSFINISGLAVGMAVAMLIGLWIWDELSFNSYYKNYETIAQIARKEIEHGEAFISENSNHFPIPMAKELRSSYGNYFKHVALVSESNEHTLSVDNNRFARQGMYVEPDFTAIFTLKMVEGTSAGMNDPHTILLTRSLARSLFGNEDAVGKVLKLDNKQDLKIAGVFEDMPRNARFADISFFCPWDLLVSSNNFVKTNVNRWIYSSFNVFVQAAPGVPMEKISRAITDVYWSKVSQDQPKTADTRTDAFLYPMKDWHLRSEWKNGIQAGGRIQLVWLFGMIGSFVLLLACINFMNLSTARSQKRARETGIRKTMGSLRSQLVKQFLSESLVVVLFSFVLSLLIVLLSLGWFNKMADKEIAFPFSNPLFWIVSVLFILITAFVSGSYPALYLSSFQPVKVLKGTFHGGRQAAILRQAMVTLQFAISIALIVGTLVVYRQVQHAQDRPLGYNKNGLIRINMNTPDLNGKYDVLRHELIQSGGAADFAQSSSPMTQINDFDDRFEWAGKDPALPKMAFSLMGVTVDFGKTIGWQMSEGRDFSKNFASDSAAVILNEAAVKYMRLKNPAGQPLRWNGKLFTIVGVVKDIVTESPYDPVRQSIFVLAPNVGPVITVKLNPLLSAGEAIRKIEPVFRKYNPASPFDYKFVDEEYGRKFAAEQRVGSLSTLFAVLAIFISCLGIFGLASFVAEQRTKEIGVRKVLGASVLNLWGLLSKEFALLVAIAFLIATPAAWYFMHQWLQKYEYRASLTWWIFVLAGMGTLTITLLTVSYQTVRAALMNPVKSLRSE